MSSIISEQPQSNEPLFVPSSTSCSNPSLSFIDAPCGYTHVWWPRNITEILLPKTQSYTLFIAAVDTKYIDFCYAMIVHLQNRNETCESHFCPGSNQTRSHWLELALDNNDIALEYHALLINACYYCARENFGQFHAMILNGSCPYFPQAQDVHSCGANDSKNKWMVMVQYFNFTRDPYICYCDSFVRYGYKVVFYGEKCSQQIV